MIFVIVVVGVLVLTFIGRCISSIPMRSDSSFRSSADSRPRTDGWEKDTGQWDEHTGGAGGWENDTGQWTGDPRPPNAGWENDTGQWKGDPKPPNGGWED
jgi:hypothetical protein